MYMVVYVSSAAKLFSEQELMELLERSRKTNSALDITGMLLYKEGNFMQFLEGPREAVLGLLTKIKTDPRQHGMIIVMQEEHAEREFDHWSMGFKKLDSETSLEVPGYSEFLDLPLTSEQFLENPSKALKLLLKFKTIMS